MAILSTTDRERVGNTMMRPENNAGALDGLLKGDLRAAVDATDDWIEANQAAYNAALPLPARTALTAQQKTLLFCWVAMRRAGRLKAQED